jgi:predicted RNase H-like HicB family nuclease
MTRAAEDSERAVYPFTFVFKQEGEQWAALACEVDVASCGSTLDEAREGLQEAVELYVTYLLEHDLRDQVARPVPAEVLAEFCQGGHRTEYHSLIVDIVTRPAAHLKRMEFVPSQLEPADCRHLLASR